MGRFRCCSVGYPKQSIAAGTTYFGSFSSLVCGFSLFYSYLLRLILLTAGSITEVDIGNETAKADTSKEVPAPLQQYGDIGIEAL